MVERWQCPHCKDEMDSKFRVSHQRACAAVSRWLAPVVEWLIADG